jgi:plasmid maintenance system antidote protein VapI
MAVLQRDFILFGDGFLQPVTRASLADELDVHESTISRAVSDKSVQLPSGHIIPLARFFDRSLQVRTALKQIIDQETQPYSDTMLVELLNQQGYQVARRTVAKYRAMEGILPSHLRAAVVRQKETAASTGSLPAEAISRTPRQTSPPAAPGSGLYIPAGDGNGKRGSATHGSATHGSAIHGGATHGGALHGGAIHGARLQASPVDDSW